MQMVFLDTNVIISGTFFSGLEADLLSPANLRLVTADVCQNELLEVTRRKFSQFGYETQKVALKEVKNSLIDVDVIVWNQYSSQLELARNLVTGENDQKVLAAALHVDPDYFVTGDQDFHQNDIRKMLPVKSTQEVMEELNLFRE